MPSGRKETFNTTRDSRDNSVTTIRKGSKIDKYARDAIERSPRLKPSSANEEQDDRAIVAGKITKRQSRFLPEILSRIDVTPGGIKERK